MGSETSPAFMFAVAAGVAYLPPVPSSDYSSGAAFWTAVVILDHSKCYFTKMCGDICEISLSHPHLSELINAVQ